MRDNNYIYNLIHDRNVMVAYRGEMTGSLTQALLSTLEPRLQCIEQSLKTRKKLYTILLECLQNIIHHQDFQEPYNCSDHATTLLLTLNDSFYCLNAGNMIANSKIEVLKSWLDNINSYSREELQNAYLNILGNGAFSDKGTAGLGFMEIVRKAGEKLQYSFEYLNEHYSIFSFCIQVPRSSNLN